MFSAAIIGAGSDEEGAGPFKLCYKAPLAKAGHRRLNELGDEKVPKLAIP